MSFITGVPHPSAQSLTQHGYDEFNRLASAGKSGQAFSYDYDRYGNRWHQNVTAGSGPAPQYTFNTSNRITTFTYDAAGNLTNDGSHSYTYDAEGRMTAVDGGSTATYVYDAQGRRVRTVVNGTASNVIYDLQGQAVALVNDSGGALREEVWSPLGNIATYAWDTTFFNHTDWLGTGRAQSNVAGGSAQQCSGLPFGDGLSCTNSEDSPVHFTGLERDSESAVAAGTGLDHAWFRQYSSIQGRWMTPDPAGLAASDTANPQSWNRYAYVMNNPTNLVDPLGLRDCLDSHGNVIHNCPDPGPRPDGPPQDPNLTAFTPDPFQPIGKRTVPNPWVLPQRPGSNNAMPQPANNCVRPNRAQRAAINVLAKVAKWTNKTVGYGFGASYGLGFGQGFGFAGTASAQLQVSPGGNASLVYTYGGSGLTQNWLTPSSLGAAFIVGPQIGVSSAPPSSGPGADIAVSGVLSRNGVGPGASVDVNGSADGVTGTLTGGVGAGLASGSAVVTQTAVVPFCTGVS